MIYMEKTTKKKFKIPMIAKIFIAWIIIFIFIIALVKSYEPSTSKIVLNNGQILECDSITHNWFDEGITCKHDYSMSRGYIPSEHLSGGSYISYTHG